MEGSTSEPQIQELQTDLYLSQGLSGQDDCFDYLLSLFEQLQLATVETCNPALDIMTFAEVAYYFAVIMKKIPKYEEEMKDSTSSDNQVGVSGRNMPNPKEELSKTFFEPWHRHMWYDVDHPKAQALKQGPMGMSSESPDPFIEGDDSTQQTNQNSWSNLHHDPSLDGPSVPDYEMEGHFANNSMSQDEAIGLVYLVNLAGPAGDYLRDRELNIGIILGPLHRGKGYAHQAIELVLKVAFETEKCHRVQAILPDHVAKDRAICLFTQMRFDHEGTRRRAFYSQMEGVYKDVTYMGMLDTDWMLHTSRKRNHKFGRPAPKSVWDELLSRHQREREELLNWEAGIRSSGAYKTRARTPTQSCYRASEGNDEEDDGGVEIKIVNTLDAVSTRKPKDGKIKSKTLPRGRENDPFVSSTDFERSDSPDGYFSATSSSGSAWDVVEPSDLDPLSSSSSDSEDEMTFDFEFVRGNSM